MSEITNLIEIFKYVEPVEGEKDLENDD